MRFLFAFVAILGYASASAYAPLVYGVNAGDAQAAAIDATVAAKDYARTVGESYARAAEANRDIHQSAYWGSVAANQNAVAAAQNYVAATNGVVARAGLAAPYGYAGWAAPYGIAAPYGVHGLGYRAW